MHLGRGRFSLVSDAADEILTDLSQIRANASVRRLDPATFRSSRVLADVRCDAPSSE
jgi:hypothetical protein